MPGAGFQPNIAVNPNARRRFRAGLLPFDLTRGGSLFAFHGTANINQYAFYVQDAITAGHFLFNVGFRLDRYDGLISKTGPEPRLGIAYNIKKTGTVLRVAYARTFETPFNENLLLSSATGVGGLGQNVFGSKAVPIQPGFRNQFNTGFQQAIGKLPAGGRRLLLEVHAQRVRFQHAAEHHDHVPDRLAQLEAGWSHGPREHHELHGFQAYWTFGHTRARYFPPEDGGLIPQGLALGWRSVPHRPRSGVPVHRDLPLSAQERRVDRVDLAL